ncbi:radical SAM family heme chaperone HemW [Desulfosarcina cetonica]|uniref:radical SAM family heme chaperone HemW n=1 Tax=Desulfosarcina cetonica TaxID=90730 RepID=UPI0006D12FDF|nr:radical SAM family heme chaperone HemW [Desulfosarcina cetonica]
MPNERPNPAPAIPGIEAAAAGIYIHVPFCQAKCPYCDFYSVTDPRRIPAYIDALLSEIAHRHGAMASADTVYFGGGTPSLLSPGQIERVLDTLRERFIIAADAEITLEVNPGTVDSESLHGYRRVGVNRLNIGLQSINDSSLRFLGRIHTAVQARTTFHGARAAGFDNIGLDLIYGLPGQAWPAWRTELEAVVALGAEHLSCYTLTLEAHTPLMQKVNQGLVSAPDEAQVGDLFVLTIDWLNAHGYPQYEISNFARRSPGNRIDRRSRHNRKYWNFAPYLGFGPAAHSYRDNRRWWNHRDLSAYLADLRAGHLPVAETEILTREQQLIEAIYLGLRQTDGIDTVCFRQRFGFDFFDHFGNTLVFLRERGWVRTEQGRVRLTGQGMRWLEQVAGFFIQALG